MDVSLASSYQQSLMKTHQRLLLAMRPNLDTRRNEEDDDAMGEKDKEDLTRRRREVKRGAQSPSLSFLAECQQSYYMLSGGRGESELNQLRSICLSHSETTPSTSFENLLGGTKTDERKKALKKATRSEEMCCTSQTDLSSPYKCKEMCQHIRPAPSTFPG